jgi:hypothetical protein
MTEAREAPFFLVGHDRSGTTMLRLILDRGEAAIPAESMFLADFAPLRRRGGLEQRDRAERLVREVWSHPHVRLWDLAGGPPELPPGLGHADAYRFAVESPFAAYARQEGKSRWGDKTPAYLHYLDELSAIWPDSRFVVLVRDGRDVALSVTRLPFGPNNVWAAARAWSRAVRIGKDAHERFPGRVHSLRYEDLAERPEQEMRGVCEFLGLAFDSAMLAIERTDAAKIVEDQSGWFTSIWAGINTGSVGRWRKEMSPADRRIFESAAGAELEALGYERVARSARPPSSLAAAAYTGHDAVMRVANFVRLRVVQEHGREVRYVVERKLAGAWR